MYCVFFFFPLIKNFASINLNIISPSAVKKYNEVMVSFFLARTFSETKRFILQDYQYIFVFFVSVKSLYRLPIQYEWIEKLLETPIEDGRKYALWKILCPYSVNIKKLEYDQSYKILKTWLENCNNLRNLDFNPDIEIKAKLKNVKYYNPISIKNLIINNKKLYLLLRQKL